MLESNGQVVPWKNSHSFRPRQQSEITRNRYSRGARLDESCRWFIVLDLGRPLGRRAEAAQDRLVPLLGPEFVLQRGGPQIMAEALVV